MHRYRDRADAGRVLAAQLAGLAGRSDVLVLGLPRGGVPVAGEVASALAAPLDVLVVRKLGLPRQPELAMGAIAGAAGAVHVVRNEEVVSRAGVSDADLAAVLRRETEELRRRETRYRGGRLPADVRGRVAVLVDDGLATGATVRAGVLALRGQGPARVVVAVPVGSRSACSRLAAEADEVVCPWVPEHFSSVSQAYQVFTQTSDLEVRAALAQAVHRLAGEGRS